MHEHIDSYTAFIRELVFCILRNYKLMFKFIYLFIFVTWEQSGFVNFIRDKYTALPDTRERMVATEVTALWR